MITFNRWSYLKNEPNTKLNHVFLVSISFCPRKVIKNETKKLNKNGIVCSIFVIFLIFWSLEFWKHYGDLLFLSLVFTYFPIMNNSWKLKEISSTSFYCIIPPERLQSDFIFWPFSDLGRRNAFSFGDF